MKNDFLRDRKTAWAITCAVAVLSVLLGGARSLGRLRSEASDVFFNGTAGDGMGISRELERCAEYAYNMLTVANRYIPDDEAVKKLESTRGELIDSASIADKSANGRKLIDSAAALYDRLGGAKLTETDAKYRESLHADIKARSNIILNDGYNREAREFNKKLAAFPANLIKTLRLATELPEF